MLGALLLSAPPQSRNRNLFEHLLVQCGPHLLEEPDQKMLLASTIAIDDTGARAKVSSICTHWESLSLDMVNGYPKSFGQPNLPPANPYRAHFTDCPLFAGPTPSDVMVLGNLEVNYIATRATSVYSSMSGTAFDGDTEFQGSLPGRLLVQMSKDDQPEDTLITKLVRNVLEPMVGNYACQIVSAGPDPMLVLLRRGRPVHLYLMYQHGSFYLVWSDFVLPPMGYKCSVWPMVTFDHGPENMVVGFSIRMLRDRWVKWLSPRIINWANKLLPAGSNEEQVTAMCIPVAIAALAEWLSRHSNEPVLNVIR